MARNKSTKKRLALEQLPSGSWRAKVQYTDIDGTVRKKSITGATVPEVYKKVDDFEKGLLVDEKLTVRKAIRRYIDAKKGTIQATTLNGYECIFRSSLQSLMDKQIYSLKPIDVQKAISEDAMAGKSYKTIKNAIGLLRSALALHNAPLPAYKYSLPAKKKRKADLPDFKRVLQIINGSSVELPCLLAINCGGMRISEVRGLQYRDIIERNGKKYICIERARVCVSNARDIIKCTKTETSERIVPLPDYLFDKIMAKPHDNDTDFIIDESYKAISGRFKRLMERNGITNFTFHGLRKEFATMMNLMGVAKETLQLLGGWANSSVLDSVYICPRQGDLETSIEKLSDLIVGSQE